MFCYHKRYLEIQNSNSIINVKLAIKVLTIALKYLIGLTLI